MMKRYLGLALVALLATVLLAGCKSQPQPQVSETPATGTYEEPLWVTKGGLAFPDDAGRAIYGVGVADRKAIPLLSLRRQTAVERARADVAGQIRTLVQAVFKDYSEAALTGGKDEAATRSLTSVVQKSVLDETLYNTQVVDRWTHPKTGDEYALVRLGMDGVAPRVGDTVFNTTKDQLKTDSDKAHQELDAIIEKYRKQPLK